MKRISKKTHLLDAAVGRLKVDVTRNIKSIADKVENIDFKMKDIETKINTITHSVEDITSIRGG